MHTRPVLDDSHIHPSVQGRIRNQKAHLVDEVQRALHEHTVLVVGMSMNPFPRKACRALDEAGIGYHYLQYGSYLSAWRERLALKLWTGWSTFPMVFVKGVLVGGAQDVQRLIDSGEL
jgi:monothiol glutaredoxin